MIHFNEYIPLFSWGMFAFEVLMPAACLILPTASPWHHAARRTFLISGVGFHLFTYFVTGASFMYNVWMFIWLLTAELRDTLLSLRMQDRIYMKAVAAEEVLAVECYDMLAGFLRWMRRLLTSATLIGWFLTNLDADTGNVLFGIFGINKPMHKGDRLYPFSIHSMYTRSRFNSHDPPGALASCTTLSVTTAAALYLMKMRPPDCFPWFREAGLSITTTVRVLREQMHAKRRRSCSPPSVGF